MKHFMQTEKITTLNKTINRILAAIFTFAVISTSQIVFGQPCASAPSGLQSWYRAENNANDERGVNNGTLQNGATFAAGQVGQTFNLDGTDDFILLPSNTALNSASITVEGWINPQIPVSPSGGNIFSRRDPLVSEGFSVVVGIDGSLAITIRVPGTSSSFESAPNTIQFGQFQHVAATYDANSGTLAAFVNGASISLSGGATLGGAIQATSNHFIGRRQDSATVEGVAGARYFKGLIDEFSIYDRALSAAEIGSIFNAGSTGKCVQCTPAQVGLVSTYSGDNNTLDSRSRNNGAFVGASSFSTGKVGQAFNFTGSQSVQAPDTATMDFTNAFTIEMWVNPPTAGAGDGSTIFISKGDLNFANTQSYAILFNSNRQVFNRVGNGSTLDSLSSTSQIPLNTFTHIATTYDGTTLRIYVNGILDNSQATSIGTLLNSPDPLFLGGAKFSGGTILFPAAIDETSLYNRALSASEIAAIANAGNGGKCKPTATAAPSGQAAWLAGDGDARDIAGTNNGTLQNGAAFAVGKVGQSFNLDGSDDSIQLPLNQSFQNFTLESWVKPSSAVSDPINQELILGQAGFGAQLGVIPGTSGGMRVKIQYRDTINSFAQLTSTVDIPLNDWSFLTGTYDGTTLKLYINGALNAQMNPANTTVQTCNTPYFIGGFQPVTDCNAVTNPPFQFFNGLIDEASVYNRALTDVEVQSIFNAGNAGKLKTNSTIDTNSVVSLWQGENNANDARGANNGSLNGTTFTPGKVGQAFDPNDTIASTVADNALLNQPNLTLEAWFTAQPYTCVGCGQYIAAKSGTSGEFGYELGTSRDTGQLRFTLNGGTGGADLFTGASVADGDFHHVSATYDGATMKIFLDGALAAQKAIATTISYEVNSSFVIGSRQRQTATNSYNGLVDEMGFYNRALTAAEIRANYEAGNALSTVVGDARITFPSVTTVGTTQQIPLDKNLFPALPMGAMHTGLFYDIDTSAAFTGNPTVCFNLPPFTPAQFAFLGVMHFENNNWVNVTAASNTYPALCTVPLQSFSPFAIVNFAPTAAAVSVSGRVRDAGGKGIARAQVSLTGASGETRSVSTNQFGFYRFGDVAAGETYVLTVSQKRRAFPDSPRVLFVSEDLNEVDFTAATGGLRGN